MSVDKCYFLIYYKNAILFFKKEIAMNDREMKFFNGWKQEHLSIITEAFEDVIEETEQPTILEFDYIVRQFTQAAFNSFAEEICVKSPKDIPKQFSINLFAEIIGGLNSALPRDHQYVIIGVFSDKSPDMRIAVTERKIIPGYHDIINTRIIPIFNLTNTELLEVGSIVKNIKIENVNFGNQDLEETI